MTIKQIHMLTLNDLRNMSIKFDNEEKVIKFICGNNSFKMFHFVKHFKKIQKDIKSEYRKTNKICIPLNDNNHVTLNIIIIKANMIRAEINEKLGVDTELEFVYRK